MTGTDDSNTNSPDVRDIPSRMLRLGLAQLARSVVEVTLFEDDRPEAQSLATLDAAQAAERILRARILEHEADKAGTPLNDLQVARLVYGTPSLTLARLPEALHLRTGFVVHDPNSFGAFSILARRVERERIDPDLLIETTLKFSFETIEPLLIHFWNEFILAHTPDCYWSDCRQVDEHVYKFLKKHGITPSVRNEEKD